MNANADNVSGISIEVEDLVNIRTQLAGLSLANIRHRSSYHSGAREVRLRGRGMEYEESRAYVSGDDVRTMDWRVMARTGEAHTKIFSEEKERRFLLAIDLSASMYFGTRVGFKSWAAAQVAAHVGWLASFADDRIGGLVVSPEFHHEVRPGKTRSGLLGVFHHLAEASKIKPTVDTSSNRLNKGARVYVLPCIAGHVGADAAGMILAEEPHLQCQRSFRRAVDSYGGNRDDRRSSPSGTRCEP